MLLQTVLALLFTGLIVSWWIVRRNSGRRNQIPFPPGPPGEPLIGHLRKLPREHIEDYFYDLSKDYGKVARLSILGRTMIILNSTKAAVDLLDKKGAIYSDRASSPIMDIMGWEKCVAFMSYGKVFRQHRRMLNEYFNQDKCVGYRVHQAVEAKKLVRSILKTPEGFMDHLSRFSTAIILRIVHGQEIHGDDSPYIRLMTNAGYCITNCAPPGSNSVDLFPILQHFPSWFPGTKPATLSRRFKPMVEELYNYPYEDVVRQMENNTALDSFISSHIEELNKKGDQCPFDAMDIKGAAATCYTAGTDTTWATILLFIFAMVHYPSVQSKAQAELDGVIGSRGSIRRLPTFEDRDNLPYLEGVLQESYRWYNSVPSGLPHRVMEDDVYEGMFIPKGATIIPNTRGMTLDKDVYKDASIFDPSRYSRGEPHPVAQFGFGRRICPGKHLADASVWIVIAYILALFDIKPDVDENGKKVYPSMEFVSGLTLHPKPFRCYITPRTNNIHEILQDDN